MSTEAHAIADRFIRLGAEDRRQFLTRLQGAGLSFAELPIVRVQRESALPLSHAQMRQWFLWKLDEHSSAYHTFGTFRLHGSLDVEAMRACFAELIERHESLRTVFPSAGKGTVTQVIQPVAGFELPVVDLSYIPDESRETAVAGEARRLLRIPFDLTRGPLFRATLIRSRLAEHVLVVVMHHIVSDGWSMQLVVDEFAQLYRAKLAGETERLPALPVRYADYAQWQRSWLEAGEQERQLSYWKGALGTEHPVLQLPVDRPRLSEQKYRASQLEFEIPRETIDRLRQRAREHGATLFMSLLAGFQALLHRCTGQSDVRVGVANANRNRAEVQGVVGFFVNTRVLRSVVDTRYSLSQLLDHARDTVIGAQEYQELPFELLVDELRPERSLNHSPLFQVMMNHQRQDLHALADLPGLTLQRYELEAHDAQFELVLNTTERADGSVQRVVRVCGRVVPAAVDSSSGRPLREAASRDSRTP